ncbi:hypothetical protein E5288_WYG000062 [Bos mutus]|uniref:Uncharacterized protein n=1 Tax=Bos mutus TaxID=72004 RepID=A0A6B0RB64_9CETA|nr:hypothetical protein [Bos mutus]
MVTALLRVVNKRGGPRVGLTTLLMKILAVTSVGNEPWTNQSRQWFKGVHKFNIPNLIYSSPVMTILSVTSVDRKQRDSYEVLITGNSLKGGKCGSVRKKNNDSSNGCSMIQLRTVETFNGPVELVEKLFHGRALWLPPCLWCIEAHKENPEVHGGLTVAALSPLMDAPEFIKHSTVIRASAGFPVYKYMWVIPLNGCTWTEKTTISRLPVFPKDSLVDSSVSYFHHEEEHTGDTGHT